MPKVFRSIFAALGMIFVAFSAQATLIGDTIGVAINIPQIFVGIGNTVVSADSDDSFILSDGITSFFVDPSDSGVVIRLIKSHEGDPFLVIEGAFIKFFDLDWTDEPGFVSAADTINDLPPGTNIETTFSSNSATASILFPGTHWQLFGTIEILVFASHDPISAPEPATLTLFGLGLLGLGVARRRKKLAA